MAYKKTVLVFGARAWSSGRGVTTTTKMALLAPCGVRRNTQLEGSPGQATRRHPCGIRNVTRPSRSEMVSPGRSCRAVRTRHMDVAATPAITIGTTPAMIHASRNRTPQSTTPGWRRGHGHAAYPHRGYDNGTAFAVEPGPEGWPARTLRTSPASNRRCARQNSGAGRGALKQATTSLPNIATLKQTAKQVSLSPPEGVGGSVAIRGKRPGGGDPPGRAFVRGRS